MKLLCRLGFHDYKFFKDWPNDLQPNCENMAYTWRVWLEKCQSCQKEKSFNDLIK